MIIPTEPIGSIPRPQKLITAFAQYEGGSLSEGEFESICSEAVRDTIENFEATGSPVITDGYRKSIGKTLDDLRKLIPITGSIAREIVENQAAENGFVRREYRALLEEALSDTTPDDQRLYKWSIYNPEVLAKVAYSRFEQPADETATAIREAKRKEKKAKKEK
jgi:methionine synthase II (cobalamin-independent)